MNANPPSISKNNFYNYKKEQFKKSDTIFTNISISKYINRHQFPLKYNNYFFQSYFIQTLFI